METLDGLIEGFPLVARIPIARADARPAAVGVVTTTAGGATMVVDPLASRGVHIAMPGSETLARLRQQTGIEVAAAHMVDLTVAGTRYEAMKAALDVMLAAPEFDLVLAVVGSSARFHPDLAVQPIVDCALTKPLTAFMVPDAGGVGAACSGRRAELSHAGGLRRRDCGGIRTARRSRARDLCKRPRPPARRGGRANYRSSRIARAPSSSRCGARSPRLPFAYPIAVKALSAEIAHKSDVGGVVLNVPDSRALLGAIQKIKRATKAMRVLVQPMMAGVGEALLGYRVDPDVGPLVMLAAGGVMAEVYRDRSLRLAPVDVAEARDMIAEVRMIAALARVRGRQAGDLDALAQTIVKLSRLADDPTIAEAEINPLMYCLRQGVVAVDALVKLAGKV